MQSRWLILFLSFSLMSAAMFAAGQTTPLSNQDSSALEKLDAWTGHWRARGESLATAYSHAASLSSETTCQWSINHGYMICDQMIDGPKGRMNALSIYTYSEADKAYRFYGIDQSGQPRTPPLTIQGNVWTYGGGFEADGKQIQIRTVNEFETPSKVDWRTEFSSDGGQHWSLMNHGTETRISY